MFYYLNIIITRLNSFCLLPPINMCGFCYWVSTEQLTRETATGDCVMPTEMEIFALGTLLSYSKKPPT